MRQPTIIVIYAPTKRSARALRDVLVDVDLPIGIEETHWIAVGNDSASRNPRRKKSLPPQRPSRKRP